MAEPKVLVVTPNFSNVFSAEVDANRIECAVAWTKADIRFNMLVVGRTFVHFARSQACHVALEGGYTHIFWLDDDAIIAPGLLAKYLAFDKEVIVTPYFMRRPPYECGVLKSTTGQFHDHRSYRNLDVADLHQGLIEIDGGGTHAMLIKTSVLQQHGDPTSDVAMDPKLRALVDRMSPEERVVVDHHLGTIPDETRSLQEENDQNLRAYFIMPKYGTEDMLFCYRLKRKGVRIWCDTDATSGHVGFPPVITEAFRARTNALLEAERQPAAEVMRVLPHDITAGPGTPGISSARREGLDRAQSVSLV